MLGKIMNFRNIRNFAWVWDVATVFVVLVALGGSAFAGTIRVPTDYPTIQAAIDAAQPGDQVLVASGTYYEHVTMKGYVDLLGGYEITG